MNKQAIYVSAASFLILIFAPLLTAHHTHEHHDHAHDHDHHNHIDHSDHKYDHNEDQLEIMRRMVEFTIDVSNIMMKHDPHSNVLFSPFNLYTSLALALLASKGTTTDELLKLMKIKPENLPTLHSSLSTFLTQMREPHLLNISVANAVFLQKEFPFEEEYKSQVAKLYASDVTPVDFEKQPQETVDTINKWVSEKTRGFIGKLYEEPLDASVKTVLASALYFSGKWEDQFMTEEVKKIEFKTPNGAPILVDGLNQAGSMMYHKNDHLQFESLSIPYENHEASMFIVLPYEQQSLENLTTFFTGNVVSVAVRKSESRYVDYTIPRMKLDFTANMVHCFRALGINNPFNAAEANFEKLSKGIYIDEVAHRTILEVNEQGTIAGSVSGMSMRPLSMPVFFTVDRPFLFYIYHRATHSILFNGVVYDPTITAAATHQVKNELHHDHSQHKH